MKGTFTARDVRGSSTKGAKYVKEYRTWQRINSKCYNPNHHRYANYGGRGIGVDDLYRYSFLNFLNEVGECPEPKLEYSIERIDNNEGYVCGNMEWIKIPLQALNKTSNHMVEHNGVQLPLSVVCKDLNINYDTATTRLARGFSLEDALNPELLEHKSRDLVYLGKHMKLGALVKLLGLNYDKAVLLYNQGYSGDEIALNPISYMVRTHKTYEYNGKDMTVTDWAKYLGLSRTTIVTKLNKGYSIGFICDTYLNKPID